jgi:hypothetical protein
MKNEMTANSLSGRAVGALILTGFGSAWITLGQYVREQLSVGFFLGVAMFVVTMVVASTVLFRRASQYRRDPEDPRIVKAFHAINAMQWIAVFVVASLIHRYHRDEFTVSAIAFIVGLHFLPLARIFRYRPHYVTGLLLMAWAVWTAISIPADTLQGTCAIGTGFILWISATVTVLLALQLTGRRGAVQPIGS